MKELINSAPQPIEPEQALSVDEVYELIYQNEANENPAERERRTDSLLEMLELAYEAEGERL